MHRHAFWKEMENIFLFLHWKVDTYMKMHLERDRKYVSSSLCNQRVDSIEAQVFEEVCVFFAPHTSSGVHAYQRVRCNYDLLEKSP